MIIDVRTVAKSGYTPHFNKMTLINLLKKNNIEYKYMGKTLGGRPEKEDLLIVTAGACIFYLEDNCYGELKHINSISLLK